MATETIELGDVELATETAEELVEMFEDRVEQGSGKGVVLDGVLLRDDGVDDPDVDVIDYENGDEWFSIRIEEIEEAIEEATAPDYDDFVEAFEEAAGGSGVFKEAFAADAEEHDGEIIVYAHARLNVKGVDALDVNEVDGRELRYFGLVHEEGYDGYPALEVPLEGTWFSFLYGEKDE